MIRPGRRLSDPGAQQERTSLAWTRTCLAYLTCCLLCERLATRTPLPVAYLALAGTAAAMSVLGTALLRERQRANALTAGDPVPLPVEALILTAMTVGLGAVATAIIVVSG